MATATKMWSKEGVTAADGEIVDVEGWHVVDEADKRIALATPGLPQYNDPNSDDPYSRVRRVNGSNYNGPTQWLFIVEYAVPPNGTFPTPTPNPLDRAMVWTPQRIIVSRPQEIDAQGTLVLNSAGDIYPPENADFYHYILTGRRYEPFWNENKCRKYSGKTNSNLMSLASRTILPYECKCLSIGPAGDFENDADFLMMEYVFEIGTNERVTETGALSGISGFPFDRHIVDRGSRGWFSDGTRGRFCRVDSNGEFADYADDVILDGTGKPIDSSIKVIDYDRLRTPAAPVSNPTAAQWLNGISGSTSYIQSPFSTAAVPQHLFFKQRAVSFESILSIV